MIDHDPEAKREVLADVFDTETDPLAKFEATFEDLDLDPFEMFVEAVVEPRPIVKNTLYKYRSAYNEWQAFMASVGRQPACPTERHVKAFAETCIEENGNQPDTVKKKLRKLDAAYQYWQAESVFPHPQDYNPIALARQQLSFEQTERKDYPYLERDELRAHIKSIPLIRDRLIIIMQLKLGLRAGELCNIKLSDLAIANSEIRDHYEKLGSHRMIDDRENAVYIPHDRDGNKSRRPRVLPLDLETRQVLLRYLLIRPDNDEPWLFLSRGHHERMGVQGVNGVWKEAFHPEYAETDTDRSITSHYGRHYFTTFWRIQHNLNRELVKYMRGDTTAESGSDNPPDGLGVYLHTYYEDIENLYRENIFKLCE